MKQLLCLPIVLLLITGVTSCSNNAASTTKNDDPASDSAQIQFASERIDIGVIEPNKNANQDFKFTNTGKLPLTISEARGSCHCVQAKWP